MKIKIRLKSTFKRALNRNFEIILFYRCDNESSVF